MPTTTSTTKNTTTTIPLTQSTSTFAITLQAPPGRALPLFGPVREAEWAHGWSPRFLYPAGGAQREGTVFMTHDEDRGHAVWVLTDLDEADGRVGYVLVSPGFVLMEIKIRLAPVGEHQSRATVTYRRTALADAANHFVSGFTHEWEEKQQAYWEGAINAALQKSHDGR
jgi:hypothetical protein